ncbi:10882_t:CDS:1 [Dentiscutata heterogama]|uniref:10882_t:CDS:1 n=1 Tax=Dentiscutata heterogama TaxID=1316150 RepID=A0ACA9P0Q7_9GLOM|nr:10882_t:CDS:1 [Dentiscutata heterogama]
MIDALLDMLNNVRKKNNLKNLEWNTQLINAASKDVKKISLNNKFAENNNSKNFYHYEQQYYNAKDENEVVNELLKTNEYKKILLDKKYNHFGASFKNKHWVLIFGQLHAKEEIDINLLLKHPMMNE